MNKLLINLLTAILLGTGSGLVAASELITVYKSPTCGCCSAWVEHLQQNGFEVQAHNTDQLSQVKQSLGVKPEHASCHTAEVGGYVIEGHVPASEIRRLLAEKPAATGLAVPGMPMGSPGMDGPRQDRYQVLLFDTKGASQVYADY